MPVAGLATLAQACSSAAPAATPTRAAPATTSGPVPADWQQVLDAAKREGKVSVNTFPGAGVQVALAEFNTTYPEIQMEQTTLVSSALAPRIVQEHQAGIFTWDVIHQPTTTSLQVLKPAGVLDQIRPLIVLQDVIDEKAWNGGFANGFNLTNDAQSCFAATLNRGGTILVDTSQVQPHELQSARDLLNAKWKGQIVITDTRISGSTFYPFTLARLQLGDDWMKSLFVEQQPVIINDGAQIAQLLAHSSYPIAIGAIASIITDYQKQGVATSIQPVRLPEFDMGGPSANGLLWFVNKAPHPNAAKVYVNWFLSRAGQAIWAKNALDNSRRLDVEPGDPTSVVPPDVNPPDLNAEKYLPELARTQELAKQLIT
jgi:iron(III) transport system substrate-binding protein